MESIKKLLPYLLVAIIFAVGGYFIGHGGSNDLGASLYKATPNVSGIITWTTYSGTHCTRWTYNESTGQSSSQKGVTGNGGCVVITMSPKTSIQK